VGKLILRWNLAASPSSAMRPLLRQDTEARAGEAFFDPLTATASLLQDLLTAGTLKSTDLVEIYIKRIHQYDGYLKAILSIAPTAVAEAQRLDEERSSGRVRGPLHGIPVVVKVTISPHCKSKLDKSHRIASPRIPTWEWTRQPAVWPCRVPVPRQMLYA
jgi:hypothetical protein